MKRKLNNLLALAFCCLTSTSALAIEPVDGVYMIGTAQDWAEFCTLHNEGTDQKLNAELTADITVEGNVMVGINGGGKPYRGVFDGKGHKLVIAYDLNEERVAPFRRINGATIRNLIVEGTINTSSKLASGLVGGLWQSGALIQNCVSYVVITDTNEGDATHGGICGSFEDVNGANTIENCAFLGTINAPNREGCGGIVGWTNNNANNNVIRNCLVKAYGFVVKRLTNNDIICRNNGNVENCYFIGATDGIKNDHGATHVTDQQAQSGELCFLLNGSQSENVNWFQKIGTDDMPMPFGTDVVYANGSLDCGGHPKDDVTFSNTAAEPTRDDHNFSEWGFCSVCNEMQPDFLEADAEGYFNIGTKQQYNWLAVYINNGHGNTNFRLTQDLDLSDYTFLPLGTDGSKFCGTFDGQQHRILNMTIDGTKKEQGFFSVCAGGTVIKNVIIDSSCKMEGTGGANVAALIGCINGNNNGEVITIQNVGNEMSFDVTTTNNAGFVARDWSDYLKVDIQNCYNTGDIMGGVENGAFTGWTPRVTLTNCWNTGRIEKTGGWDGSKSLARGNQPKFINSYDLNSENTDNAGAPEGYDAAWIASGQLCYVMNGKQSADVTWFQKLGDDADAQPYPFGDAIVYANGALQCDGITPKEGSELTFSNTEGNTIDDHDFGEWGFCTVCNEMQPDFITPAEDGYFEIADNKQLNWFAMYVNTTDNKAANARLTADINFSEQQVMIGNGDNDDAYKGTFDGQGHKVTLGYTVNQKNVALFRYLNKATIKNLITDGTIQNENNSCSGGIFAGSRGATVIENCVSYVNFVRESAGDATIGGIGAYMHDNGKLRNVAFYGTIDTPAADGNGGLLGYANGGGNIRVENSVINAVKFAQKDGGNSVAIARNTGNVENTYVVNADGIRQNEQIDATAEQLASGELAYLLNGSVDGGTNWFQVIGTDPAPLPFAKEGATVYANGTFLCDGVTPKEGTEKTYSNEEGSTVDEHSWNEWGFCEVCDEMQPDYMAANDEGIFELGTDKQLNWFAHYATKVDASANAVLTADIDMTEVNGVPGIGNPEHPYTGTFDGQRHIISSLTIDNQDNENPTGFFNEATAGAVIKNFTIDNTCYIVGNHYVGAFVGHVAGEGEVILEQLGNEADVVAWNQNAGGIVGCNTSGELKLKLTNCYNAGFISSTNESGGLGGWLGNNAETVNCYNMGDVQGDNSESFARGNNIQVTNCFDPATDWPTLHASPIEDFTNGTVYAALSAAAPGVWFLSAEVDGHPVLYDSGFPVIDIVGDVNNDGQVGIGDIVAITNIMAGIFNEDMDDEAIEAFKARADVNKDGQVGIGDIVAITNIMAGIEKSDDNNTNDPE